LAAQLAEHVSCVEVISPDNTLDEMLGSAERPGKRELYFQAGAFEFWLCDMSGRMSFYDATGQIQKSRLCPGFPDQI
jgi:hypothetical protein